MRPRFIAVLAVIVCCTMAAPAPAATVTYTLHLVGGKFALTARASLGDNGGIASYGIPLAGTLLTVDHRSPLGVSSANFFPSGFSLLRSADGVQNVFAGQELANPAENYLYGMGQTAGSFASRGIPIAGYPDPSSDTSWGVPLVIATGTYNPAGGNSPGFLPPTADLFANLYATSGNSRDKIGATIQTQCCGGGLLTITPNNLGERDVDAGPITANAIGTGIGTIEWSNLQPVVGPSFGVPTLPANLSPSGAFNWDPSGSKSGPKGSGHVEYRWTATATDFLGSRTTLAFSMMLIPEPATLSFVAVALIGSVTRVRRRI